MKTKNSKQLKRHVREENDVSNSYDYPHFITLTPRVIQTWKHNRCSFHFFLDLVRREKYCTHYNLYILIKATVFKVDGILLFEWIVKKICIEPVAWILVLASNKIRK